jgi:hypothetical protein
MQQHPQESHCDLLADSQHSCHTQFALVTPAGMLARRVQPDPQANKLVSTSANSGNSSRSGGGVEQQATSALKPTAPVAHTESAGEEVAKADTPVENPEPAGEEDEDEQAGERWVTALLLTSMRAGTSSLVASQYLAA